ncbi:MAG: hypothetical protein RBG13Loki_3063 [Promethearchaeota archaeon CR_4]|nr:MAG: hypothetical protein RBG13Loki_3063 [Candidatus Lokiarchaeota archaeon CR_4]
MILECTGFEEPLFRCAIDELGFAPPTVGIFVLDLCLTKKRALFLEQLHDFLICVKDKLTCKNSSLGRVDPPQVHGIKHWHTVTDTDFEVLRTVAGSGMHEAYSFSFRHVFLA